MLHSAGTLKHIAQRISALPSALAIIILWTILFIPNTSLQSLRFEEGRRAFLAKDVLYNGNWLQPTVLEKTYINKPPLQPWLIAGTAKMIGALNEWSVRLPALFFTLLGALLVFAFTRMHTGKLGAILSSTAFLLSPLVMQKARLGETDMTVSVLLLAAFYIWWKGIYTNSLTIRKWLLCSMCLSGVTMAKGPVPLAYYAIPVLGFTIIKKRYRDIPRVGLSLTIPILAVGAWCLAVFKPGNTNVWVQQMRLTPKAGPFWGYLLNQFRSTGGWLIALLPWLLVALPALVPRWSRQMGIDQNLSLILLLYVGGFAMVLAFWPNIRPRYVMPVVPALAIATGVVNERMWHQKNIRRMYIGIAALLITYQLIFNYLILPLRKEYYTVRKQAGLSIGKALSETPKPFYTVNPTHNVLFYTNRTICEIDIESAKSLTQSASLIVDETDISELSTAWAKPYHIIAEAEGKRKRRYFVVHLH